MSEQTPLRIPRTHSASFGGHEIVFNVSCGEPVDILVRAGADGWYCHDDVPTEEACVQAAMNVIEELGLIEPMDPDPHFERDKF